METVSSEAVSEAVAELEEISNQLNGPTYDRESIEAFIEAVDTLQQNNGDS